MGLNLPFFFTEIDDPKATVATEATGINDAGEVVGGYYISQSIEEGFTLIGGNYTTIDLSESASPAVAYLASVNSSGVAFAGTTYYTGPANAFVGFNNGAKR